MIYTFILYYIFYISYIIYPAFTYTTIFLFFISNILYIYIQLIIIFISTTLWPDFTNLGIWTSNLVFIARPLCHFTTSWHVVDLKILKSYKNHKIFPVITNRTKRHLILHSTKCIRMIKYVYWYYLLNF